MKKYSISLLISVIFMISCSSDKKESPQAEPVTKMEFGKMPDGTVVEEYTITNSNGIEMKAITYGGIIRSLKTPDKEGNLGDIVLGYDNLKGYIDSSPYFGAIIGRYGNRIAKGKFTLDSVEYTLAANNIGNHLHGGIVGFDKVVWSAKPVVDEGIQGVEFSYNSKDMEEGYPGNLEVHVKYLLDNENNLIFEYFASTDKKTIVNLTNHAYYNLSASDGDILGHQLMINADTYIPVDSTLIPTQIESVQGTPFDFTSAKAIGEDIDQENIQLKNGGGYDHCWVLNESDEEMNFAASLYDPESGRLMEIYTQEPGIQFYSGNFLDGSISGKGGRVYEFRTGLCLETQHYPDSPNRSDFPSTVLEPGEEYYTKTITKFSTK